MIKLEVWVTSDEGYFPSRTIYVDFKTTGRWKTIKKGNNCTLYIEIVEQKDVASWYQFENIQPVTRWIHEDYFVEIDPTMEVINECSKRI